MAPLSGITCAGQVFHLAPALIGFPSCVLSLLAFATWITLYLSWVCSRNNYFVYMCIWSIFVPWLNLTGGKEEEEGKLGQMYWKHWPGMMHSFLSFFPQSSGEVGIASTFKSKDTQHTYQALLQT